MQSVVASRGKRVVAVVSLEHAFGDQHLRGGVIGDGRAPRTVKQASELVG